MKLELRDITKRFPGVIANDSVSLEVNSGEVLALLGENGAGKSTLMNILYGLYSADEGEILIDGSPMDFHDPGDAIAAGLGMVHQHFMLVPVFDLTENVILGVEPTSGLGHLNLAEARRRVSEISDQFGLNLDPTAIVEDLPVGVQQRIEILKVLFREAEIIIFDEPTAVLTPQEVSEFFEIIRGLQNDGKGIIFITHKLGEVLTIADRIVVLRRGKVAGEVDPETTTREELSELMVGRPVQLVVEKGPPSHGDVVLKVSDLAVVDDRGHGAVSGVSFEVRAGEIVGVAGVQGNGQTELVEAITGLRTPASGTISIEGVDYTGASPRRIHEAGVAHIPEDRQEDGLVLDFDLVENVVLNSYYDAPYSRGLNIDWDYSRSVAEKEVADYDVRAPSVDITAGQLSGGNQQKLIVAREFARDTTLVVGAQPTRGVDVGSIEYIHAQIVEERDEGSAVLIVSSELDEVTALADRILVMFRGEIVAEVDPQSTTHAELGLYMAGETP
ncbi:MAG: ATP-binding cassette domain-containing protein [Acidimicrobiia bacterium]|nr:ATP-binding cassette domain-containing protein [Acidimicrobiia bacterium]